GLAYIIGGRPRIMFSRSRSTSESVSDLTVGEWSCWIGGSCRRGLYAFRLKLISLEIEAGHVRLYRSSGHLNTGYTKPESLAAELTSEIGPIFEWTGTFDFMNGLIDLDTQFEIYDAHTAWLEKAICALDRRGWDGFFTQWHVVEY